MFCRLNKSRREIIFKLFRSTGGWGVKKGGRSWCQLPQNPPKGVATTPLGQNIRRTRKRCRGDTFDGFARGYEGSVPKAHTSSETAKGGVATPLVALCDGASLRLRSSPRPVPLVLVLMLVCPRFRARAILASPLFTADERQDTDALAPQQIICGE